MKVKTFSTNLTNKLDMFVNTFISSPDIEVIDIKFSTDINNTFGTLHYSAMVIYKDKE